jgi:hypothetical protein
MGKSYVVSPFPRSEAKRKPSGQNGRPGPPALRVSPQVCLLASFVRDGRFVVERKTQSKRLTAKLKSPREEACRRSRVPVRDPHRWLRQVLRGHYAYYAWPSKFCSLKGAGHLNRTH